MKKLLIAFLIGIVIYGYIQYNPIVISQATDASHKSISNAYKNRLSDIQVTGSGEVSRILTDDKRGSCHQRFIIRLSSGQTVLIAHNIDVAPKIKSLQKGDIVHFFGEYEWTPKGGVVHWTHHDPDGHHIGGWLKHDGHKYE